MTMVVLIFEIEPVPKIYESHHCVYPRKMNLRWQRKRSEVFWLRSWLAVQSTKRSTASVPDGRSDKMYPFISALPSLNLSQGVRYCYQRNTSYWLGLCVRNTNERSFQLKKCHHFIDDQWFRPKGACNWRRFYCFLKSGGQDSQF